MNNSRQPAPAALISVVIFLSAFLLFALEPLVARRILPWFGGSSAVWSICLVFYQTALLAGYLYARLLTRYLSSQWQAYAHISLLTASLVLLPIGPGNRWKPFAVDHPALLIIWMLAATIGLPFLTLSATSPLLQAWLARSGSRTPYRMFAVSNFASLAALLVYPTIVEPSLGTRWQSVAWSMVFAVFALLCGWVAWWSRRSTRDVAEDQDESGRTANLRKAEWFALAACGSMLLLAITNHIDENVAAVPFLWVLPLAIYLLSFVLTFGSWNIYRRSLWTRLLAFTLGTLGYAIYNINSVEAIQVSLPIFLAGLFVCCLFCHGELNRLRPPPRELTSFYLFIAAGGAAGAIFIGLLAPLVFEGVYELPLALVFTALLAWLLIWRERIWALRLLWGGVTACMVVVAVANVQAYHANALSLRRSFYGSLRVTQTQHAGVDQERILYHGTIEHGSEFVLPPRQSRPTTYYGPDSGIGILLRECYSGPKRIGVVGLGTGTLAAYGRAGDEIHYFEINPQVSDLANALFFYLRDTPAHVNITIGDGRLALERETGPPYDVLVLDAFSGDAIPIHLLTREAMNSYRRRLKIDGAIAFHVSNDFLDLGPVVARLANDAGYRSVMVHNHRDDDGAILPADWVLVTNNPEVLENAAIRIHSRPINQERGVRVWTDDYNNLFQALKTPSL